MERARERNKERHMDEETLIEKEEENKQREMKEQCQRERKTKSESMRVRKTSLEIEKLSSPGVCDCWVDWQTDRYLRRRESHLKIAFSYKVLPM